MKYKPRSYIEQLAFECRQAKENWREETRRMADVFIYGHENPTLRERFSLRLIMMVRRVRWWFIRP